MQTVESDCSLMALHHELSTISLLQLVRRSFGAANINQKYSFLHRMSKIGQHSSICSQGREIEYNVCPSAYRKKHERTEILYLCKNINPSFRKTDPLLQAYSLPRSAPAITPTSQVLRTVSKLPARTGAVRLRSDSLIPQILH
jgi:hypothetical protein